MTLDRKLIAPLPLFADVAEADLDYLLARARSRRIAKDVKAFEQGAPADTTFFCCTGA